MGKQFVKTALMEDYTINEKMLTEENNKLSQLSICFLMKLTLIFA